MWETGFVETLFDLFRDDLEQGTGRVSSVGKWWNKRVEQLVGPTGRELWDEMKENGEAISVVQGAGGNSPIWWQ